LGWNCRAFWTQDRAINNLAKLVKANLSGPAPKILAPGAGHGHNSLLKNMAPPLKILAIQFKYFGDAVLLTPALRALHEHFPSAQLHLLVPEEVAPIFQHLPWLNRVWPMPRRRGSASLRQTWPVIRALRREHFDRSADFASNDRGAILSFLIGARHRLGRLERGGFWGRRFCYNQRVAPETKVQHESARLAHLLSAWGIVPSPLEAEIRSDPALAAAAEPLLPPGTILCHVASSQPKKEWPLHHWAEFYQLAAATGLRVAFTTAVGVREQQLMAELKKTLPDAPVLPAIPGLPLFLAVLNRAEVFVSGDTGPLHFAAGLGVPTISLFGPSSAAKWAPVGSRHQVLAGSPCQCDGNWAVCQNASHCLAAITPEQVFERLQNILASG
jgi:ADP-heptose:LPS heptosyltransferase